MSYRYRFAGRLPLFLISFGVFLFIGDLADDLGRALDPRHVLLGLVRLRRVSHVLAVPHDEAHDAGLRLQDREADREADEEEDQ